MEDDEEGEIEHDYEIETHIKSGHIGFITILFLAILLVTLTVSFYVVSIVLEFNSTTWSTAFYTSLFIVIVVGVLFVLTAYLKPRDWLLYMLFAGVAVILLLIVSAQNMINNYGVNGYMASFLYLLLVIVLAGMISYLVAFVLMGGYFGLKYISGKGKGEGGYK